MKRVEIRTIIEMWKRGGGEEGRREQLPCSRDGGFGAPSADGDD